MPVTVFNIRIINKGLNRICECIRAAYVKVTVFENAHVVIGRIVIIKILPGINWNSYRRRYILESNSLSGSAQVGTEGLQNKCNTICSITVLATQENTENVIKRLVEIDQVFVPYRS